MTHDQNKKTLRHFQCRDYLWEIFEQMSQELECSTDYLINEAMRQYARSRNYTSRSPSYPGVAGQNAPPAYQPPPVAGPPPGGGIPSLRQPHQAPPSAPPPPPPPQQPGYGPPSAGGYGGSSPSYGGGGGYGAPPSAPQPPSYGGGSYGQPSYPQAPPPARPPAPSSYPPPATNRPPAFSPSGQPSMGNAPPPLPGGRPMSAQPSSIPPLYVIFNGQKIPVNKPEFVIGRGSKTADLPIKDGNISRRHAAVVFENGGFYMKDLGSTNGIEFQGQRIENKQINEGDVYQLCDYELRFTYR